ncbi:MAG: hypothetical protein Q7K35_01220 [bacterium]|nr:hypothetical protein [bacterium]
MNKNFKKNILVYLVIFIVIILLLNWLIKSGQANRSKNQAENFNVYYKELLRQCGIKDKELYNCCFSSIELMSANNFKLASGIGCDPGFKINTFKCLGSFKWCEMAR